eukprot:SAG31_NODE_24217_length_486_cov_1.346253_1_plen_91_part_01
MRHKGTRQSGTPPTAPHSDIEAQVYVWFYRWMGAPSAGSEIFPIQNAAQQKANVGLGFDLEQPEHREFGRCRRCHRCGAPLAAVLRLHGFL